MIGLKNKIEKKVKSVFFKVWPPLGEDNTSQIDISIGLAFEDNEGQLVVMGTDMEDIWSPKISIEEMPVFYYSHEVFGERMKNWMSMKIEGGMMYEYFDMSKSDFFSKIIGNKIIEIFQIYVDGITDPFGLKIVFSNDYILSCPNADGNTIETMNFNNFGGVDKFSTLGNINFISIFNCSGYSYAP